MNDDEFNEMLARSDDEAETFRVMDTARERDALETWRAAGNRGRPPLPLMQLEELPECYQTDEPFEVREMDEVRVNDGGTLQTTMMARVTSSGRWLSKTVRIFKT